MGGGAQKHGEPWTLKSAGGGALGALQTPWPCRHSQRPKKADDGAGFSTLILLHSQTYETYNVKFHVFFFTIFANLTPPSKCRLVRPAPPPLLATPLRSGRQSVGDDVRVGAPRTAITDLNISRVETCILADRRVTVREIANELSLSVGSVETIIHEQLKFFKVSARWVPKQLTGEHIKQQRLDACQALITRLVYLCM